MTKEMEMENVKEAGTVDTEEAGSVKTVQMTTENREQVERKVKDEDVFDTNHTGSGAAAGAARPEVQALKSAISR